MGPTIEALTRDFSWSVIEALRSYDAERTGVPCPASLLKNATQARQAFHGSVLRRRDGTYHIVDFTGGVKTSGDAICLMLKPLAGGPAKQFYPAELAQSVEWISMGCLSNKSFSDASDTPPLKQGGRAVAGIKLAGTQIDCRILWDETKHQIRLDTASGTVQELEGATPEQISKKTDLLGAPWDVARPEINQELLEGIRGRVVDVDDFLSGLAEAVWAQEHGDLTQRQQQQLLASTAHDDASLVRCHASAGQHFDRMLGSILIIDRSELTFGLRGPRATSTGDTGKRVRIQTDAPRDPTPPRPRLPAPPPPPAGGPPSLQAGDPAGQDQLLAWRRRRAQQGPRQRRGDEGLRVAVPQDLPARRRAVHDGLRQVRQGRRAGRRCGSRARAQQARRPRQVGRGRACGLGHDQGRSELPRLRRGGGPRHRGWGR